MIGSPQPGSRALKRVLAVACLLLAGLASLCAFADSWMPPSVQHYDSADGNWRLTVYPRELTSQLAYFEDKVADKPNAGGVPGDSQRSAMGHMERRTRGGWETVWKLPLANEVSPVDAVVSNRGEAVTLDNWHSMGWGDDAIVIYSANGDQLGKFGLAGFLPKPYLRSLPRSVSSIHWRGDARIDEARGELVVPVVVPTVKGMEGGEDDDSSVDIRFRLADGSLVPPSGKAWDDALASAARADARRKELEAEQRRRFLSPLSAPVEGDERAWHGYLVEAFFRLDPEWEEGYPATQVVPLPKAKNFALLSRYLREALVDDGSAEGALMIAALSQDVLVKTLQEHAKLVKPGFLAKARIYVAADDAHMPAVRAALAHTGAQLIQLDIAGSIPQRKERLERYLENNPASDDD